MKTKALLFITAACGASLVASAEPRIGISLRIGAPPPVIVREAPPQQVIVESRAPTPAPAPNHVWVPSHHSWVDGRWVRVEGAWVVPPRPDATWVEGRWDRRTQSWTEEHWEVSRPASYDSPNSPPPPVAQPGPPPQPGYADSRYSEEPSGEIIFETAPPPLREERMIARPSPQHVWIAGYWAASHGRHEHEWVSGHWEVPPRERATWVAPRWEQRGRNYVFIRGYWRQER